MGDGRLLRGEKNEGKTGRQEVEGQSGGSQGEGGRGESVDSP